MLLSASSLARPARSKLALISANSFSSISLLLFSVARALVNSASFILAVDLPRPSSDILRSSSFLAVCYKSISERRSRNWLVALASLVSFYFRSYSSPSRTEAHWLCCFLISLASWISEEASWAYRLRSVSMAFNRAVRVAWSARAASWACLA